LTGTISEKQTLPTYSRASGFYKRNWGVLTLEGEEDEESEIIRFLRGLLDMLEETEKVV
jgi:hypothetical protein